MYHQCCTSQDYCVKSTCDGPSSLTGPLCVPNMSHKEVPLLYLRMFVYFVLAGLQINTDFENMKLFEKYMILGVT